MENQEIQGRLHRLIEELRQLRFELEAHHARIDDFHAEHEALGEDAKLVLADLEAEGDQLQAKTAALQEELAALEADEHGQEP